MLNLFVYRSTLSSNMMSSSDPVGPDNDRVIVSYASVDNRLVAAWGHLCSFQGREESVQKMTGQPVYCLGQTENGQPKHPLYLKKDSVLVEMIEGHHAI